MRNERRALWLGLLLSLLLLRAMRAFLSTVSYESLATLRLNGTAFWLLVLLVPLAAPWSGRRVARGAIATAGAASVILAFVRFTPAYLPVAALATAGALFALVHAFRRDGVGAGLVLGLGIDGALLLLGDSQDPTLTLAGSFAAAIVAALAVLFSLRSHEPPAPRGMVGGAALGAFLAVEIAFLASPFAAARWVGLAPWVVGIAALGGIAAGAFVGRGGRALSLAGAFGILALALGGPLWRLAGLAATQAAMGAAATRLAPRAHGVSFALGFAPLMLVLLFFRDQLGLAEWGLVVPLLAAAAIVGSIMLPSSRLRRAPVGVVVVLALVLISAWPVERASTPEGREITVVTFNVHQGFGNRHALDPQIYVDILRALDADVVLLQESDSARLSSGGLDIAHFIGEKLGMHVRHANADPAILSRFAFAEDPPSSSTWSFEAAIDVNGTTVWIESVHLARSPEGRAEEAEILLAAEGVPRIVAGDFNFFRAEDAASYARLMTRYEDAWVAAGHARDDPDGLTFSAGNLRRRIDLILVDGIEVVSAERILTDRTRAASDHLPVVARLRVP